MIDILGEVKKLHLSPAEYAVWGSGVLQILGIRPAQDIDLLVIPPLFNRLLEEGTWKEFSVFGRRFLKKELFEIADTLPPEFPFPITEVLNRNFFVEGIPFVSIEDTLVFKKSLENPREKDKHDIERIEKYLTQTK